MIHIDHIIFLRQLLIAKYISQALEFTVSRVQKMGNQGTRILRKVGLIRSQFSIFGQNMKDKYMIYD